MVYEHDGPLSGAELILSCGGLRVQSSSILDESFATRKFTVNRCACSNNQSCICAPAFAPNVIAPSLPPGSVLSFCMTRLRPSMSSELDNIGSSIFTVDWHLHTYNNVLGYSSNTSTFDIWYKHVRQHVPWRE